MNYFLVAIYFPSPVLQLLCSVLLCLRFSVWSASVSMSLSTFLSFCFFSCLHLCLDLSLSLCLSVCLSASVSVWVSLALLRFFLFLLLSLNQLLPASIILVNASACASGSASLFLLVFNCLLFKIYWFWQCPNSALTVPWQCPDSAQTQCPVRFPIRNTHAWTI